MNTSDSGLIFFFHGLAQKHFGIPPDLLNNFIISILVLFLFSLGRLFLSRFTEKRKDGEYTKIVIYKVGHDVLYFMALIVLLKIWLAGKSGLASYLGIPLPLMDQIANSILVVLFYFVAKRISSRLYLLRSFDVSRHYTFNKSVSVALAVLVVLVLIKIWLVGETNLTTYFGLLSAGIAIALQDLVVSLAAGIYLIVLKPFKVGQRVQVMNFIGDVADMGWFHFSLMEIGQWVKAEQATGRILHFPNSVIFKNPVANYNAGFEFIWSEIPVVVTFESNWEKAYGIIKHIAGEHTARISEIATQQMRESAQEFKFTAAQLEPVVWTSVENNGVLLTLRFLCPPSRRRAFDSRIWQAILKAFAKEADIDFAYPTQRFFNNSNEGKPAAGGPAAEQIPQAEEQAES